MNKSIQLTQTQIKAVENGATMLLFPIIDVADTWHTTADEFKWIIEAMENHFKGGIQTVAYSDRATELDIMTKKHAPLQVGDKDVFVQEEYFYIDGEIHYHSDYTERAKKQHSLDYGISPADLMCPNQSRRTLKEILDVKIVRVREILELHNSFEILENLGIEIIQHKTDWNKICEVFKSRYITISKEQNINRTYSDNDYVFLVEFKR